MPGAVVVRSTVPSRDDAIRIGTALVEEHLAACVQVGGPITSVCRWEGEARTEEEWVLEAKTRDASRAALVTRLTELHPYQVPEILVLPVVGGHPPYLEWIIRETT